jgi:hypothetical protein
MINFLKISFFTFTIWILAAFINAVLFTLVFNISGLVINNVNETIILSFLFSLLFSVPAIFFLWIVFLASSGHRNLSSILLKTAFVLALLSCIFIPLVPGDVYEGHWFLLSFIIVTSSVSSVLLHHSFLKTFYQPQPGSHV